MLPTDTQIAAWRARADQAPLRPRDALRATSGGAAIGSIEAALAQRMGEAGLPLVAAEGGWCLVDGSVEVHLARIAVWLRDAGIASAWRDELLAVDDEHGARVGLIERAAVRPLGIATRAVHLIGWAEQGGVWVQQRALNKATDPGQWDTLMGGLMAGDEDVCATLTRETWEEAGLNVAELRDLRGAGTLTVKRPVSDGYMVERIDVFEALVPAELVPQNQDGEVAAFERLTPAELQARLAAGAFTLEAALLLADAIARRRAP